MFLTGKILFDWQEECLNQWLMNGGRGIANVVTGGGKTLLALGAIVRAREAGYSDLRVKIVVPKIFLVHQWGNELRNELGVSSDEIGYFYGGCRESGMRDKPYILYVINSARYTLARHIAANLKSGRSVFLIADECHHYSSVENLRIFDFLPGISQFPGTFLSLGLSATPTQPGKENELEPFLGKEIYRFGFASALESNIISQFQIFSVGVDFSHDELEEYRNYSVRLRLLLRKLKSLAPVLRKADGPYFFATLQKLTQGHDIRTASLAQTSLILAYRRRDTVYRASARTLCVEELIARLDGQTRILIFGERIEVADVLYRKLASAYPSQVGRYHSGMSAQMKKDMLTRYQTGQIRILISCRALDEGLNVPETDVGIILSESDNVRQKIQRLGRILRKPSREHAASLYWLYVKQTNAQESGCAEFLEFPTHSLTYNTKENEFLFPVYNALCETVFDALSKREARPELIQECIKNMRLGEVRGDFLLSEELCAEKLRNAGTQRERNYWIAQSCLIRVRLGKPALSNE